MFRWFPLTFLHGEGLLSATMSLVQSLALVHRHSEEVQALRLGLLHPFLKRILEGCATQGSGVEAQGNAHPWRLHLPPSHQLGRFAVEPNLSIQKQDFCRLFQPGQAHLLHRHRSQCEAVLREPKLALQG